MANWINQIIISFCLWVPNLNVIFQNFYALKDKVEIWSNVVKIWAWKYSSGTNCSAFSLGDEPIFYILRSCYAFLFLAKTWKNIMYSPHLNWGFYWRQQGRAIIFIVENVSWSGEYRYQRWAMLWLVFLPPDLAVFPFAVLSWSAVCPKKTDKTCGSPSVRIYR